MVTGDNKLTAIAIARECNILNSNPNYNENDFSVMEGVDFY
jgi:magnesium-transporting ATPase (P-type)